MGVTVSNVGGGDSPQMGRAPKPPKTKMPKGARVVARGKQLPPAGASHGEHPNARRERLRRIAQGGRG